MGQCTMLDRDIKGAGIYIYYFGESCENSYIGSTTELRKRRNSHLSKLRNNRHECSIFQNAYNKYGENLITYEVLEQMIFPEYYEKDLIKEHLEARERYWQEEFGSRYIILKGGDMPTGKKSTNRVDFLRKSKNLRKKVYETDDKGKIINNYEGLRDAVRETGITNIVQSCKLVVNSIKGRFFRYEDTIGQFVEKKYQKKGEKLIGRSREFLYKPVVQYSIDGEFIKEYKSIKEASEISGVLGTGITRCCQKKLSHCGEFIFRYKDCKEEKEVKAVHIRNKIKPILCYKNGNLVGEFSSMSKASKEIGIHRGYIYYYTVNKPGFEYRSYTFKYK